MDQRVSLITLGVKDLGTSKRFYVDGFGWKPVFENKEIIFFQAGGMIFALFLRDQLAADFQAEPAPSDEHRWHWPTMSERKEMWIRSFNAPWLRGYDSKGTQRSIVGRLLRLFRRSRWVAWEVAWNPAWRLAPDGSVEFREGA